MIRTTLLTLLLSITMTLQAQDGLFILGGELSNSAATSVNDIDEVMPRMKALGLNTVLVPAYWEFLEPTLWQSLQAEYHEGVLMAEAMQI